MEIQLHPNQIPSSWNLKNSTRTGRPLLAWLKHTKTQKNTSQQKQDTEIVKTKNRRLTGIGKMINNPLFFINWSCSLDFPWFYLPYCRYSFVPFCVFYKVLPLHTGSLGAILSLLYTNGILAKTASCWRCHGSLLVNSFCFLGFSRFLLLIGFRGFSAFDGGFLFIAGFRRGLRLLWTPV